MSEFDVIQNTKEGPITQRKLEKDLDALGVRAGMVLVVHSSLNSLGWVSGGAPAVILALESVLGKQGTLVMPTHSGHYSDPAHWENPPVPEDWKPVIRETMPAFDRALTPTRSMGALAECFRKQQGAVRSSHPHYSFAARGPEAERITADQALDYGFGEETPLGEVYRLGGQILLMGVGQESNTSLHLAEYRANYPGGQEIIQGAPILVNGKRQWVQFRELVEESEKFPALGEAYQQAGGEIHRGMVGNAASMLIPQRPLVDFAVDWILADRK
ncbi:MAG: AAC(3) family N-acetyltransferase [Anaerolineales bacterium]|nr:AAC(3) family N-acetyltransferase [Anaerolineales bacterium]